MPVIVVSTVTPEPRAVGAMDKPVLASSDPSIWWGVLLLFPVSRTDAYHTLIRAYPLTVPVLPYKLPQFYCRHTVNIYQEYEWFPNSGV